MRKLAVILCTCLVTSTADTCRAEAKPKKLKADLKCTLEASGKTVVLPAKKDPRLDGPIQCQLTTTDERVLEHRPTLKVGTAGKEPVAKPGKTAIDNGKYIFTFALAADADYSACGEPFTITTEVVDEIASVLFSQTLTLKQKCWVPPKPESAKAP